METDMEPEMIQWFTGIRASGNWGGPFLGKPL